MKQRKIRNIFSWALVIFAGSIHYAQSVPDKNILTELHLKAVQNFNIHPEKSRSYALAGVKLSEKEQKKTEELRALNDLSYSYILLTKYDSALYFAYKSLKITPAPDTLLAYSFENLGQAYFRKGYTDSAVFYLQKDLSISGKLSNKTSLVRCLYQLGAVCNSINDSTGALSYFKMAQAEAEELGDVALLAKTSEGLGSYYYSCGKIDLATAAYKQAEKYYSEAGMSKGRALCLVNLGSLSDESGSSQKAISYYEQALDIFKQTNSPDLITLCYSNIGATFGRSGMIEQALQFHHKARAMADFLSLKPTLQGIYMNISDCFRSTGNSDSALFYFERSELLKDSIENLEKLKFISSLQEKYNKEKREAEILHLSAKAEMNHRKNILLLALSVSLACLCLMLYIIYRIRVRSAKALAEKNEQLYRKQISEIIREQELKTINGIMEGQENERKRIAEDLHDRLGSMLATVKLHFNAIESKMESIEIKNLDQYNRANKLLDEVCNEVRRIAHNMESGVLVNFGLVAALTDLKEALEHSSTLSIHIHSYGMNQRLNADSEISLYRIIQELLSNVIKHARATEVNIDINKSETQLTVMVTDNGQGFNADSSGRNGMGLKNIQSRVGKLQGKFFVDSGKGNGTTAIIEIPLNHEQADHS